MQLLVLGEQTQAALIVQKFIIQGYIYDILCSIFSNIPLQPLL